ncbi:hypothetical protein HYH02_009801 [Chlamydomonas schloesseri]|uniref:Uncharacterized protein n=1 Tax=Chlamydomonas schloesseri TaxID=2026947 RepID=A0A835TK54_9CHLO|nr:hypothetical protein HYH02_009801 [Chlamydomonas schloesseri]|eukprot:KAG2442009.1 hypothetical protein HYH02_009801 [Chlamydomonas schloesseri]
MGRHERRGQPGAASHAAPGTPSPRALADEAEALQQQGERRKGAEAAAKFEAAAAKYQAALEAVVRQRQLLGLALGPPDAAAALAAPAGGRRGGGGGGGPVTLSEAIDMRSGLAECHQLLGDALLAAAEARPDTELSAEEERRAAGAAIRQYATAAGHYTCCHEGAVLTAPAPGAAEVAAAAAAATSAAGAGAPGGLAAASSTAFAAASAVAAAANAAAGSLGADVAVNAGNSLAALGEQLEEEATAAVSISGRSGNAGVGGSLGWLAQYDVAVRCFRAAAACYRSAEAQEEDALTLSNLADVLVQTGTCLHAVAKAVREAPPELAATALAAAAGGGVAVAVVDWAAAREAEASADFAAALAAYESACSHTDSSQGDDLPGLLCNWGAGLLSMAGCLQDPAARLPLLQQAAGRLEHAASFDRADPAPLCSLGDVLAAAGEAAEALSRAAAAGHSGPADAAAAAAAAAAVAAAGSAGASGPVAAAAHWRGVAVAHMTAALERGYGAALRLRADEPEALVGAGEVHLALARLAALEMSAAAAERSSEDAGRGAAAAAEAARRHVEAAVGALSTAVSRPERLGGWRQRCDVRYNLACALALAGRDQEAAALFGALLRCGALRVAELAADPDLAPLRAGAEGVGAGAAWFAALLQEAAATEAAAATGGQL